jgi:hypothetical protein
LPATKISSDGGYAFLFPSLPILLREIQHPIPSFCSSYWVYTHVLCWVRPCTPYLSCSCSPSDRGIFHLCPSGSVASAPCSPSPLVAFVLQVFVEFPS